MEHPKICSLSIIYSSCPNPGYLLYRGDYTTQLYTDFEETIIRIRINQTGFHAMSLRGFGSRCSFVAHAMGIPVLFTLHQPPSSSLQKFQTAEG